MFIVWCGHKNVFQDEYNSSYLIKWKKENLSAYLLPVTHNTAPAVYLEGEEILWAVPNCDPHHTSAPNPAPAVSPGWNHSAQS